VNDSDPNYEAVNSAIWEGQKVVLELNRLKSKRYSVYGGYMVIFDIKLGSEMMKNIF